MAVPSAVVAAGGTTGRVLGGGSEPPDALGEGLRNCQSTTVAMPATGIYWLTLSDKLAAVGIEV